MKTFWDVFWDAIVVVCIVALLPDKVAMALLTLVLLWSIKWGRK